MELNHNAASSRDKLIEDVKVLTKDVQELLKATASVVGDRASDARGKVQESLKVAQEKLTQASAVARERSQAAVTATDVYVRDNPWSAVGVAAGIGFLLGLGFAAGTFLRSNSDD
jgi:ElaB/YqjD/DUF883 family membrane-anchored ribosome-binding protein